MPDRYRVEWAPVAQTDVNEILEFIASRDCIDAAMDVYKKLMSRIETLVSRPERCCVPPELQQLGVFEYHELVVSPYSVFFRVHGNQVGIIAVLDRRRDLEGLLVQRALRDTGANRASLSADVGL